MLQQGYQGKFSGSGNIGGPCASRGLFKDDAPGFEAAKKSVCRHVADSRKKNITPDISNTTMYSMVLSSRHPVGVAFMLGAAISWGIGTALLKYFKWTMPTVLQTGWQLTIGSIPVIASTVLFEPSLAISQLSLNAVLVNS
jgi:hypothetical protein